MRIVHTVLVVLFVLALVIFCVQNIEKVSISYLGWSMSIRLPILVLLVYLLGMFTGWSIFSFLRRSLQGVTKKAE